MKNKIKAFWSWFKINQEKLQSDEITSDLINALDRNILSLGEFNWEIRAGISKHNMLIISPGGNPNLLAKIKGIIASAPSLDYWEFLHFKPAKKWDFAFQLRKLTQKE